jgi:dihydroneopterin aldolase
LKPEPQSSTLAAATLVATRSTVFVRGLTVLAQIGVYDYELGRGQPLVIDAELEVAPLEPERLSQTYNYEAVRTAAQAVAEAGHIGLVETFAWRLARALLEDQRVWQARVRIEKPAALAPDAQAAGVEITLARQAPASGGR